MKALTARYVTFSLLAAALVLYTLLLPGYVLLLDWIPGEYINFSYQNVADFLNLPSNAFIYLLSTFLPSWIIQKILLLGVVFSLFFLPLYYFPWPKLYGSEYLAALIAVFNPFVYERLLAGQWRVLVGYALLYPLFYFLFNFSNKPSLRTALQIFGTIIFTGMWSIHFFAIEIICLFVFSLIFSFTLFKDERTKELIDAFRHIGTAALAALLVSMYWLVPYFSQENSVLEHFDNNHFVAFATHLDPKLGVVGNILTLRGFWAEGHAWAEQFTLPGSNPSTFYSAFLGLLLLATLGLYSLIKTGVIKINLRFLLVMFGLATIFAAGVSALVIWQINTWLLEHVGLWNGFRETQKWAAVIAVVYSLLAGAGFGFLMSKLPKLRILIVFIGILIPLALAPKLLFGLGGQVSTVWYPDTWHEVDELLLATKDCRALYLPWHQYYAVSWSKNQLIANPASQAFSCDIISGQNTELGKMTSIGGHITNYSEIEKVVMNNSSTTENIVSAIQTLRESGVTHIIYTNDLEGRDIYVYPLLSSPELIVVYDSLNIKLYKINI